MLLIGVGLKKENINDLQIIVVQVWNVSFSLHIYLSNMHLLLKVLAKLPVSTATPERVFSKLERTFTINNDGRKQARVLH